MANRMTKRSALLLLVMLTVSSLVLVRSAFAQSTPKPSVPDFSLKFVVHPYDVPPKYEINAYTGKNEMIEAGYHVENKSIEVTIKNQPFTSTPDASGNYANLYYFVRFKGHYADEWGYWGYYPSNPDDNYSTAIATPVNASQSEYTTITLGLASYRFGKIPANGEIDFQVEAFIGYEKQVDFFFLGGESHYYIFSTFERSGWSNTQTVIIGENNKTPSQTPQEQNEPKNTSKSETFTFTFTLLGPDAVQLITMALLTTIVVLVVVAVTYKRRRNK